MHNMITFIFIVKYLVLHITVNIVIFDFIIIQWYNYNKNYGTSTCKGLQNYIIWCYKIMNSLGPKEMHFNYISS